MGIDGWPVGLGLGKMACENGALSLLELSSPWSLEWRGAAALLGLGLLDGCGIGKFSSW